MESLEPGLDPLCRYILAASIASDDLRLKEE